MRVAVFIGTRPEAIKMAPVVRALVAAEGFTPLVVSTGQHREMLRQVCDLFALPVHVELDVMQPNQSLAALTSRLVSAIDGVLETHAPDIALVQGDTTTVLSASLACFYRRVPFGHVEAGLRTHDLSAPFPEEANRVLASRLATVHFAPTQEAYANLVREHVPQSRIIVTGNTVIDALLLEVERQKEPGIAQALAAALEKSAGRSLAGRPSVLITGHRRENFGGGFVRICEALTTLAGMFPAHDFIYPVHLNPNVRGPVLERLGGVENILLIEPQPYDCFVHLMARAAVILTDSGGVQEEAPSLGVPVLVMRDATERPEGLAAGTVRLVGTEKDAIVRGVSELLTNAALHRSMSNAQNPYGDGQAATRIVDWLAEWRTEWRTEWRRAPSGLKST